jgi:hypothetical protein
MKPSIKTGFGVAFFLALFSSTVFAAECGYFSCMARGLVRGAKNVVSAPAEIPLAVRDSDANPGLPIIRHSAGLFVEGPIRAIDRAASGLWDFLAAFTPGQQQGIPVNPETLF